MIPIAEILIAAVASGVAEGLVGEAYQALKSALKRKQGADSDVVEAVESLEKKPESKARQAVVAEEVEEADLAQDPDLVKLAQELLEALKETEAGQKTLSKYNLHIENSEVGNIGDHAHIEGGIHFGEK